MVDIAKLVRKNIIDLVPYSSARKEYTGTEGVFLDANENPFGDYNRYPDSEQKGLKSVISELKNIPMENIFLGNGSDEVIDLLFRVFCEPGKDRAIVFTPTYGMYEVCAAINDVEITALSLDETFQPQAEQIKPLYRDESYKLLFICSPNNPTGNNIDPGIINEILENFRGIVVIDEAYIDFSEAASFATKIREYPNLAILQTLSKAWGMASLRIGIGIADREIISLLNKVKPPYNISGINQETAISLLKDREGYVARKNELVQEKARMINALKEISLVIKVYPSDANFLLVEVDDADVRYRTLVTNNLIVRNRNSQVKNSLRITIGTAEENNLLIKTLKAL